MIKLQDIISTNNKENEAMLEAIIKLGNKQIKKTYKLVEQLDKKTLQSLLDNNYDGMLKSLYKKHELLCKPELIPYFKALDESVSTKIWRDVVNDEILDIVNIDTEFENE